MQWVSESVNEHVKSKKGCLKHLHKLGVRQLLGVVLKRNTSRNVLWTSQVSSAEENVRITDETDYTEEHGL